MTPRPRLTARLEQALQAPLTLVSAPAGFGKTTLLADWCSGLSIPAAWLTVDAGDRDLARFVTHTIAAVESVLAPPGVSGAALRDWLGPYAAPAVTAGEALAEALLELSRDLVLVIDDYHLAASVDVESFAEGLVRFMPRSCHLVLSTRNDPTLPLARMRLQRQLIEVRGEELRFTEDETRALLAAAGRPSADPGLAALLQQTTGGWAAGLRLASLSLPDSDDPSRIVGAITGDQHLMDFLVDEVLANQPADVQDFLLRTAIVDRICAPLADALLDQPPRGGSAALLRTLARERIFFEPEGDEVWYRRHPLVHSLLLHQLESRLATASVNQLHARAGAWFGEQQHIDDAIRHGLAAGDMAAVASLAAQQAPAALAREDWSALAGWLQMLPPALIEENPRLLLARAWVAHLSGRFAPVRDILHQVDVLLERSGNDTPQSASMRAECTVLGLSQLLTIDQDPDAAARMAHGLAESIHPGHRFARGLAYLSYGCALQSAGRTDEAVRWLTEAAEREAECIDAGSIRALMGLVYVHRQAGNYADCLTVAGDMLSLAERYSLPVAAGWARWALGWIAYERNDLETALSHFSAIAADRQRLHLSCAAEGMFGLALTYQAQAMRLEADATVRQLEETVLDLRAVAYLPSIHHFEGRLALLRGTRPGLREPELASDVALETHSLLAFEHAGMSRVKILLGEGSRDHLTMAWRAIERLRTAAEAGCHHARLVEILALAALVCEARGEHEAALSALTRSLDLGAPAGFRRTYLDLGPALVPLLERLAERGVPSGHLTYLLAELHPAETLLQRDAASPAASPWPHPFELLTVRESEVLHALCRRLSYQEIADELFISVHTVKSHTTHIYEKLGASNRRQALARAESLGLTPRGSMVSQVS